ncbi:MAG: choice-of-anchor D domain-containing protein [bacterium]
MKTLLRTWTLAPAFFFAASLAATAATVTLTASPADGGTVSGAGTYVAGKSASISAKANKYWSFVNWTGGATTTTVAKLKLVISNDVSLTATFTPATGFLSFSTNSLNFGSVPITLSATQTLTLANTGPGTITVKKITLPKGYTAIPAKLTIASGASQPVSIVFKPTAVSAYNGAITVSSDAARTAAAPAIAGSGGTQTRIISLTGNLAFGDVASGSTATRPLIVRNTGNSPMSITGVTWSNNTATAFSATPTAFTVPVNGTATVNVTFAPKTAAVWNATLVLTVTSLTSGSRAMLATGAGTGSSGTTDTRIIRLASILDFGEQYMENPASRLLTVYNDGNVSASITSIKFNNDTDKSFSVTPTTGPIPAGGSTALTVTFLPKSALRYSNVTMVIAVAAMTGGTNAIQLAGNANAWVNGTWVAKLKQGSQTGTGKGYAWQNGTNVVAEIKADANSLDVVFDGGISSRTNIVGHYWTNGIYKGTCTFVYTSKSTTIAGTINVDGKLTTITFGPRDSSADPDIPKPDISSLPAPSALPVPSSAPLAASPMAAAAAGEPLPSSLTLTVLATADGASLACTPDGRCAVVQMCDGVATVIFPDGLEPLTGVPVIVVETVGADTNANGLPDAIDAALGGQPPEGMDLLTVRKVEGWLLLETPYTDRLHIEGAAVPTPQLPVSWQVTPAE